MGKYERTKALHRRLLEERRRVVEIAAESGQVPPKGLLTYLADLDSAALAVEGVLDQWVVATPIGHDAA